MRGPQDAELQGKIKCYVDLGCKGFGEHKVRLGVDDPRSKEIYRICGKLDTPVLLHIDHIASLNMDVETYERVMREFSNAVFIAHGPGWWREISGKAYSTEAYPKGKVEAGGRVDRILQGYPNAYAEISAGSGYFALQRDTEFAKGFMKRNYKKLLFGTDLQAHFNKERNHLKLMKSLSLNENIYKAVTYKNAVALLELS